MTTLRISTNDTFDTVVTVRESDPYSKQIFFKMEADIKDVGMRSCTEHFMTPVQLERLGSFLISEALKIQKEQYKSLTE